MKRRWATLVVLAVAITVVHAGLRGDVDQPRADCESNCTTKELPKFCSTPNIGNDGAMRCKKMCCAETDECGVLEETRGDGKLDRSPYCKVTDTCKWYSGARTNLDRYEPSTQCCTDYGVEAKFPMAYPARCKDKAQKSSAKANGCGPRDKPMTGEFTLGKKTVSFTPACNAHDVCYGTCGASRATCNDKFDKAMRKVCTDKFAKGTKPRKTCLEEAATYAEAVILFGGDAFDEAQKTHCQCCP